ncbi:hypothetical protein [Kiloniella laminariae]|uniref:hypothetical protein n=1 Tax=Kiloniella laminariae TaxID=454162 RepID=UPI000381D29C|nr:hypothetical protein [Kiloniella laminariae]
MLDRIEIAACYEVANSDGSSDILRTSSLQDGPVEFWSVYVCEINNNICLPECVADFETEDEALAHASLMSRLNNASVFNCTRQAWQNEA